MENKYGINNAYMFFEGFYHCNAEQQDAILERLNTIKVETRVDKNTKLAYYEEFNEVYGDFGEEDVISDMTFLSGRYDICSIERLKYLSMWYDLRVEKGLYEGDKPFIVSKDH